jgi:hypothetical protein
MRISGTILLGALIFAPWCWGCTWPVGIHVLDLLLLAATAVEMLGNARQFARLPPILMLALMAILIEGWAMTLNSRSLFAPASGFFAPIEQPLGGGPGSVERDLSWEAMARLTGMSGALVLAVSLGRFHRWRSRFVTTMILTGVSIVLLGCWQRWTRAGDIFWSTSRHLDYFFATYRNVTNAGEYLNVVLPLAAVAALNAVLKCALPFRKAGAISALTLLIAGSFVSGSKIAPLLTGVLGVVFLALQAKELRQIRVPTRLISLTSLTIIGALALIIYGSGLGVMTDRWHRLFHDADGGVTLTHRLVMDRTCLAAVPTAGALGFGPGTFEAVFPSLPQEQALSGFWLYAHNDYLQTWLEWGWVGTGAWSVYLFGAMAALVRGLSQNGWRTADRALAAGLLTALFGIALMALIDFPLQIASIQLQVAVIAGMGWSSLTWPRANPSSD